MLTPDIAVSGDTDYDERSGQVFTQKESEREDIRDDWLDLYWIYVFMLEILEITCLYLWYLLTPMSNFKVTIYYFFLAHGHGISNPI